MCRTSLAFYGSRLAFFVTQQAKRTASSGGKTAVDRNTSSSSDAAATPDSDWTTDDDMVAYVESIQAVVQAINVAKVAEALSRTKEGKSATFNMLPPPPLDMDDRNARRLWDFLRTLRSCDPRGAFHRRPPAELFGDDTAAHDA